MNDAAQPLNGQQMSALQAQMQAKLAAIVRDIDLRKWSVDQACGVAGAEIEAECDRQDILKLARDIHAFLTEGAQSSETLR